jgi:hypothetical protein
MGDSTMSALPPVGPELAWRNRQIIAERLGWPAGALAACEAIELAHPAWYPNYCQANTIPGFEAPAGFYASRRRDAVRGERTAYGATPEALREAIEAIEAPPPARSALGT